VGRINYLKLKKMDIKITGFTEPKSWYRERIGDVFEVLEELKDIAGNKVYIVHKGRILNSYVDARDCEVCEAKQTDV
jgi:hypothetical protein